MTPFKDMPLGELLQRMPTTELGDDFAYKANVPTIYCVDGTALSVQASRNHYCSPRNDEGPYTKVEVGYPSVLPPDLWNEYREDDIPIYGWVPIELVYFYIASHGGIDFERTFDGFDNEPFPIAAP